MKHRVRVSLILMLIAALSTSVSMVSSGQDPPDILDLDLLQSTDKSAWIPVSGNLNDGFEMTLDTTVEYHYLNVENVVTTEPLATPSYFGFYLQQPVPSGFMDYWAAKGVVEGAGGWQGIMWEIINGNQPMFYLRVQEGATEQEFMLVDGLQYLLGWPDDYLRVNGDYPTGDYSFTGTIEATDGTPNDITVQITFKNLLACPAEVLHYWKLDETSGTTFEDCTDAADASCTDCPTPVVPGQVYIAQDFDGSPDGTSGIAIGSGALNDTAPTGITVMAWVNPDTLTDNDKGIVVKGGVFILQLEMGRNYGVDFTAFTSVGPVRHWPSNCEVPAGQWSHIAGTYDGNATRVYLNGAQCEGQTDGVGTLNGSATPYEMGYGSFAANRWFDGKLDEVAVFNTALNEAEINAYYQNGVAGDGYCQPPQSPTAITLASFTTTPQGSNILVAWETATELDNLGFHLYRAHDLNSERLRLNAGLIPAQAPGSAVGAAYSFVDDTATPGISYYYWLEDIDIYGAAMLHGPVSATVSPLVRLLPMRPRLAPRLSTGFQR